MPAVDRRASITLQTIEEVEDGVILELEVVLYPEMAEGTGPDKWSVTWVPLVLAHSNILYAIH